MWFSGLRVWDIECNYILCVFRILCTNPVDFMFMTFCCLQRPILRKMKLSSPQYDWVNLVWERPKAKQ